jgi:hypothetical protein
MSGILSAIRGGPSSQPTISKSIQLAHDTGKIIQFLYVVNLDFLTHSSNSKTNHISQEISEIGEFILLSALERAGYRISYGYFMPKGLPALFITVSLALIWLYLRF